MIRIILIKTKQSERPTIVLQATKISAIKW